MKPTRVTVSRKAERSLRKVPKMVAAKFFMWVKQIEEHGLSAVQSLPGYNDEALGGKLKGIRSIRLSLGYRAYYRLSNQTLKCIFVEEVNHHDYKKIERLFGL